MFDRRYLADSELSGKTDPTVVLYSLFRVDWYQWWQHRCNGACSSPAMAARRRSVEVRRSSPATASLGEERKSSVVMTRTYLDYLGFGWKHWRGCPRARPCGGESTRVLVAVFRTGEATIRSEVMLQARLHPDQALTRIM